MFSCLEESLLKQCVVAFNFLKFNTIMDFNGIFTECTDSPHKIWRESDAIL